MFQGDGFWILIFLIPITAIIANAVTRMSRYRAMAKLAESGKSIPPELLRGRDAGGRIDENNNPVRSGFVLMFVGIGIAFLMWAMTGAGGHIPSLFPTHKMDWLPAVGAIPFLIGVALLLSAIFERR
jgi:Domain of unknown function (DUF6249)